MFLSACQEAGPVKVRGQEEAKSQSSYLSEEAREIGCAILVDYMSSRFQETDKPLFLTDGAYRSTFDEVTGTAAFLAQIEKPGEDTNVTPEHIEKAQALNKLGDLSPTKECPALKALKAENSHKPDDDEDYPPLTDDNLFFLYDTYSVQVPLVDLAKGEAVFETSYVCGPECANGAVVTYRRADDGNWSPAETMPTWIS
ncbi:hypothetical protein IB285_07445 [Erythrobacter sp. KMU-140]|uniref:Lipoprotein n=1 Tax=Erythrobacter rubeus TaxID=2760803 RepID=A0ABR8KRX5_9SPHN|nr:hypothetical protein [Erythrobacter rubeus]